jgi:predicted nucleotide-binding protein
MKRATARPKGLADLTSTQLQAGIERLTKLVDRVRQFDPRSVVQQYDIPNVEQLSAAIDEALVRTFGPDTLDYDRYHYAAEFDNGPHNYAYEVPIAEVHQSLSRSKSRNIALLEQAVETLRERLAEMPPSPSIADLVNAPSPTVAVREPKKSRRIFVVHGHDEGAREAVARFLEKIGFEPIILHERANQGRTVIEKVEAHSDVAFAVVLLTPDDEGCIKGGSPEPRARQNVLLELGYFIGKLTRARVCTLKVGELEIPSDWGGVVDEPFDRSGAWRQTLARELAAAGFDIDWNLVMQ